MRTLLILLVIISQSTVAQSDFYGAYDYTIKHKNESKKGSFVLSKGKCDECVVLNGKYSSRIKNSKFEFEFYETKSTLLFQLEEGKIASIISKKKNYGKAKWEFSKISPLLEISNTKKIRVSSKTPQEVGITLINRSRKEIEVDIVPATLDKKILQEVMYFYINGLAVSSSKRGRVTIKPKSSVSLKGTVQLKSNPNWSVLEEANDKIYLYAKVASPYVGYKIPILFNLEYDSYTSNLLGKNQEYNTLINSKSDFKLREKRESIVYEILDDLGVFSKKVRENKFEELQILADAGDIFSQFWIWYLRRTKIEKNVKNVASARQIIEIAKTEKSIEAMFLAHAKVSELLSVLDYTIELKESDYYPYLLSDENNIENLTKAYKKGNHYSGYLLGKYISIV